MGYSQHKSQITESLTVKHKMQIHKIVICLFLIDHENYTTWKMSLLFLHIKFTVYTRVLVKF